MPLTLSLNIKSCASYVRSKLLYFQCRIVTLFLKKLLRDYCSPQYNSYIVTSIVTAFDPPSQLSDGGYPSWSAVDMSKGGCN